MTDSAKKYYMDCPSYPTTPTHIKVTQFVPASLWPVVISCTPPLGLNFHLCA